MNKFVNKPLDLSRNCNSQMSKDFSWDQYRLHNPLSVIIANNINIDMKNAYYIKSTNVEVL